MKGERDILFKNTIKTVHAEYQRKVGFKRKKVQTLVG